LAFIRPREPAGGGAQGGGHETRRRSSESAAGTSRVSCDDGAVRLTVEVEAKSATKDTIRIEGGGLDEEPREQGTHESNGEHSWTQMDKNHLFLGSSVPGFLISSFKTKAVVHRTAQFTVALGVPLRAARLARQHPRAPRIAGEEEPARRQGRPGPGEMRRGALRPVG